MKNTIVYIDLDTGVHKLGKVLATQTANGMTCYKVIDREAGALLWIPQSLVLRAPRNIYED